MTLPALPSQTTPGSHPEGFGRDFIASSCSAWCSIAASLSASDLLFSFRAIVVISFTAAPVIPVTSESVSADFVSSFCQLGMYVSG